MWSPKSKCSQATCSGPQKWFQIVSDFFCSSMMIGHFRVCQLFLWFWYTKSYADDQTTLNNRALACLKCKNSIFIWWQRGERKESCTSIDQPNVHETNYVYFQLYIFSVLPPAQRRGQVMLLSCFCSCLLASASQKADNFLVWIFPPWDLKNL